MEQGGVKFTDVPNNVIRHIIVSLVTSKEGASSLAKVISVCKAFQQFSNDREILKITNFDNMERYLLEESFWNNNGLLTKCATVGNEVAHKIIQRIPLMLLDLRALPTHGEFRALITTSVGNNSVFRSFFDKQKLTRPNFIDWYRQIRLVLSTEDKENYLEHPIPEAPVAPPGQQVPPATTTAHAAWVKGQKEVAVFMLFTMYLDIQRNLAHLERLGQPVSQNLAVSLILVSLNKDYDSFMQNYNMHGMGKTLNELHAMLKLREDMLPKKDANPILHAIRAGRVQKNQKNIPHKAAKGGHGKGKSKMGYALNNAPFASKPKTPPPPKKDNPAKDAICHQCCEVGHWRRNCPVYLVELMKKK
nr:hypothetical protein [Tanacetum cinerariifolium]